MIVGTGSMVLLLGTVLLVFGILLHRLWACHQWRNNHNRRTLQEPWTGVERRRALNSIKIDNLNIGYVSLGTRTGDEPAVEDSAEAVHK